VDTFHHGFAIKYSALALFAKCRNAILWATHHHKNQTMLVAPNLIKKKDFFFTWLMISAMFQPSFCDIDNNYYRSLRKYSGEKLFLFPNFPLDVKDKLQRSDEKGK
jgi:hypothetical protein